MVGAGRQSKLRMGQTELPQKEVPNVEAEVLGGIATTLAAVDPKLKPTYFFTQIYNVPHPLRYYGFLLRRNRVPFLTVLLEGVVVRTSYEWPGKHIPARPVPDKPGYIYPGRREDKCGGWDADIQDPKQFRVLIEGCEQYIRERSSYLEERRTKAADKKRERAEYAARAKEADERWRARWDAIQANMYVI